MTLRETLFITLGCLVMFPGSGLAFELAKTSRGAPIGWRSLPIVYEVVFGIGDEGGERLGAAVRFAFDAWSNVPGSSLRSEYLSPVSSAREGDGRSGVWIAREWMWGDASRSVAITLLQYDVDSGDVVEADVILNGERFEFVEGKGGSFDTRSVVLHEAGHVIGLAHTCGVGSSIPSCFSIPEDPPGTAERVLGAVMAPTLGPGGEHRILSEDDEAGVRAIYPATSTSTAVGPFAEPPSVAEGLDRSCPDGALLVRGERLPSAPRVELRYASGIREERNVIALEEGSIRVDGGPVRTQEGAVDVIVHDLATSLYAALIASRIPSACAPSDPPSDPPSEHTPLQEEGCGCGTVHARSSSGRASGLFAGLLACTALFAVGLSGLPSAFAFKCSRTGSDFGPSLVWNQRRIEYRVNASLSADIIDREATLSEIALSFKTWQDVACSDIELVFMGEAQGLVAGFLPGGENKNVVVFVEQNWVYDRGIIAVTTNAYDTRTGVVIDSDIEMNGETFRFVLADGGCDARAGTMDLRNTLTHEIGHLLGLDHPPNTPSYSATTMFASAPPCETQKRTLEPDDIEGLCFIYPAGMPTEQCNAPDGPTFLKVESDDGYGCSHLGRPRRIDGDGDGDGEDGVDVEDVLVLALGLVTLSVRHVRRPLVPKAGLSSGRIRPRIVR